MILQRITVTFTDEGMEISTTYTHQDQIPNPGTKTRTRSAARMARAGLDRALRGLEAGEAIWGGFRTNERISTDHVIVDREESAA